MDMPARNVGGAPFSRRRSVGFTEAALAAVIIIFLVLAVHLVRLLGGPELFRDLASAWSQAVEVTDGMIYWFVAALAAILMMEEIWDLLIEPVAHLVWSVVIVPLARRTRALFGEVWRLLFRQPLW